MVDSKNSTENIVIVDTTSNINNAQDSTAHSKKRSKKSNSNMNDADRLFNYTPSSSNIPGGAFINSLNALSNIPYFNYLSNPSTMALFNNSTRSLLPSAYINLAQPLSSSMAGKRIRNSHDDSQDDGALDDDELNQQKYPPILVQMSNGHFTYDHSDVPPFLNAEHDQLAHQALNHQTFEHENHKLAQYPRGTRKEGDTRRKRGNCRQCPNTICGKRNARQTSYFCVQCGISLHPDCFHTYHQNPTNIKIPVPEINLRKQSADNISKSSSSSANSSKSGKNSVDKEM